MNEKLIARARRIIEASEQERNRYGAASAFPKSGVVEALEELTDALEAAPPVVALSEVDLDAIEQRVTAALTARTEEAPAYTVAPAAEALTARAAVPDAATRRVEEMHRLTMTLIETRDERDAALAAVERVRVAAEGPHPANSGLDSLTLAHISAALDGAPEPETAWVYAVGHRYSDGSYSSDAEDDEGAIADSIEEARSWVEECLGSGTYSNAILVKRAPLPEWLPVDEVK